VSLRQTSRLGILATRARMFNGIRDVMTSRRDSRSGPRKRTGEAAISALAGPERTGHDRRSRGIWDGQRERSVGEIMSRGGSETESSGRRADCRKNANHAVSRGGMTCPIPTEARRWIGLASVPG